MKREEREEKIAMIGRGFFKPYPWTRLRTAATTPPLVLGGSLLALGIIFRGASENPVGIWIGSIIIVIMLLDVIFDYFCYERPNFVVKGFPKLRVIELDPLDGEVAVLGADRERHYLKPDTAIYTGEEKSYVIFSGRLDNLWVKSRFGKDIKKITTFPGPEKTK